MMFYRTVPSGTEYESFLDAVPTVQGGLVFAIVFLLIYSLYEAFLPYQIIEYMDELSHSDKIWVEKWVVLFSSRAVGTEYEILPSRRDSTIF
jgi:hypothetical protein